MAWRPRKLYPFLKCSLAMKTSCGCKEMEALITEYFTGNDVITDNESDRVSRNDKFPPTSIILLNAGSEEDSDVHDAEKPKDAVFVCLKMLCVCPEVTTRLPEITVSATWMTLVGLKTVKSLASATQV